MPGFDDFWRAHPANKGIEYPCGDGSPEGRHFDHQCCISMGVAITDAGVPLTSYKGVCCWYGHGRTHPLQAEQLKYWLNSSHAYFCGTADIAQRARSLPLSAYAYYGRTGIVLFRNFWGPGSQGDHIDLWNGATMTHGEEEYFVRSQEVWFWDIA